MESFRDSSMSDSISLYERYMRSFNVVDTYAEENCEPDPVSNCESESSCESNLDLSVNKHYEIAEGVCNTTVDPATGVDKLCVGLDTDLCAKIEDSELASPAASLLENSSATATTADRSLLTEKSDHTDVPVSSEDSKFECLKQPVFITSTMENSNNAVDSVPLFRDTRPSDSVFKLPISELTFNGTLKHVQKLKPIVDPISALTSSARLGILENTDEQNDNCNQHVQGTETSNSIFADDQKLSLDKLTDTSNASSDSNRIERGNESTGDSQYEEFNRKQLLSHNEESSVKWNLDQSYSSLEASFDSGVRSPDMFSEDDAEEEVEQEPFWAFMKDFETYDKKRVKKLEETLQGVLPPPSVTTLKTDVTELLKKYYAHLPAFSDDVKPPCEANSSTPAKRVSFVQIPTDFKAAIAGSIQPETNEQSKEIKTEFDTSADNSIEIKLCTKIEAKETAWPDILKCRYYDVNYNITKYSEKVELLSLRFAERFVGAETDTSVNVHSGGLQSPSSASKRKAMRIKMSQAKSPGRRLSHLARRRQAFCSAATIGEKAHSSAKMVLIDKNFFPHRKLINSADRKSPRTRRTPGKKTPSRKTPAKKTPAKTPKSSTKKKAMRRLLLDSENVTRSQPREIKRALFISPENRKPVPSVPSSSVPLHAMKSKRALFGSPVTADTKSSDGTLSDQFLKRKRGLDDDVDNGRSKIAKSLSFGGDTIGSQSQAHSLNRRASEVCSSKNYFEFNDIHKKKLVWAVSEALRVHGWRMCSAGFRAHAAALRRLTRRLLALPPHAARLAAPHHSTSEIMLKLARQYAFAIIQGRSVEDCYQEEQMKIANSDASTKVTGYISATAYQQMKARQPSTSTFVPFASQQVKENYDGSVKQEQPRSSSKNILQDKLVNIDKNSNSSSGLSMVDKVPLFKSNSMPSFEEQAKVRVRRQISFDNVDFPKR